MGGKRASRRSGLTRQGLCVSRYVQAGIAIVAVLRREADKAGVVGGAAGQGLAFDEIGRIRIRDHRPCAAPRYREDRNSSDNPKYRAPHPLQWSSSPDV